MELQHLDMILAHQESETVSLKLPNRPKMQKLLPRLSNRAVDAAGYSLISYRLSTYTYKNSIVYSYSQSKRLQVYFLTLLVRTSQPLEPLKAFDVRPGSGSFRPAGVVKSGSSHSSG